MNNYYEELFMETYILHCLEGDVLSAYNYLKDLRTKTEEQQNLLEKYDQTFFAQNFTYAIDSDDSWIRGVVEAYHSYFVSVLTKLNTKEVAEDLLYQSLLEQVSGNPKDMNEVEEILEIEFNNKGYFFLGGYTLPYRGPYIWRQQEKREYEVELPFAKRKLTIYLMDEFLMTSWLHFATFGLKSTGGWAKPDGLYCVRNRYGDSLETDLFQVSFLKHEAQHVEDLEKYPNIKPWELEYRAKLVEIIYGNSESLLEKFKREAINNQDYPHLFASFKLTTVFNGKDISTSQELKRFALELYKNHTYQLNEMVK
jgi:hypothetical protein